MFSAFILTVFMLIKNIRLNQIFANKKKKHGFIHRHECTREKVEREREREISFVEFYLSSLTCYHFVRGFSLWTAVLIADGVVLAKYLVTEDERWVSGGS